MSAALLFLSIVPITTPPADDSAVCRLARTYEKDDIQREETCAMLPMQQWCVAKVEGQAYAGSSSSCASPLTGVLRSLCHAAVAVPKEITVDCTEEWLMVPEGSSYRLILDTTTGEIRGVGSS